MNIENMRIPSTKGELSASVHHPESENDRLAVLCPGFLDSKDYRHLVILADRLCEEGFTVVRFDPIGVWESLGDISEYTMTQYLEDIRSVLEYMLHPGTYRQVLLGGHSRGGQMSILYAARDARITHVLGIMPSYGPIDGDRREEWERTGVCVSGRDVPGDENGKIEYRVPFGHVLDRDRYDVIEDLKKVHVPVLLFSGGQDDIVPSRIVEDIYDAANEPKCYVEIPEARHDYRFDESVIRAVNDVILERLKLYL
jgi:alpha-beta hydrolase superfamily lysophospholipase